MTGISEKIKRLIGEESVNKWADDHGLPPQTVHEWIKNDRMPRSAGLRHLVEATGIPEDWWRKSKDVTFTFPNGHGKTKNSEQLQQLAAASGHKTMITVQDRHAEPEALSPPDGFILVPRYDVSASMGNGAVIHSEQVVDHLAFRAEWVRTELGTSPRNLILISAIGDSMEPSLRAGDLLLIDRSVECVRQDAIYAIAQDGELRIKRIQRLFDGSLVIKSDNPSYRTEELTADQAERIRIVGRVVWSGRRM